MDADPVEKALFSFRGYRQFPLRLLGAAIAKGDIRGKLFIKANMVICNDETLSVFELNAGAHHPNSRLQVNEIRSLIVKRSTRKDQIFFILNNTAKWGVGFGALLFVLTAFTARNIAISFGLMVLYALLIGIAGALIISLPNFFRTRDLVEFRLATKGNQFLNFYIEPDEAERIKSIFSELGIDPI